MKTSETIKLSPKEQDAVLQASNVLKSQLPVTRVILFGSKARGTGELDSDIDLACADISSC